MEHKDRLNITLPVKQNNYVIQKVCYNKMKGKENMILAYQINGIWISKDIFSLFFDFGGCL